ncbi:MAG: MinD/ParA family protein [Rhodospirillales bacterium]
MTLSAIFPSDPIAMSAGAKTIAIASGKGGVGKTWFAITLAHALANAGQRVLLFDGDLGLANVDIQLGLMPDQDLGDVLSGRLALHEVRLRFDAGGFDVIAGRSGSGRLATVPQTRLFQLKEELQAVAGDYDYILLDLGAGVERTVRHLVRSAGKVIVVTTDEPTALTDAYAFIKLSQLDRPDGEIAVVINMASSRRDGERTFHALRKACEGFLKISPPLLGIVRRDTRVRETIRNQCSLLTRYPNTEAAVDVSAVARALSA